MNLAQELKAVTENVRQQIPAEVFAAMEAATGKLAASDVTALSLKPGSRMPDFQLPDASGQIVSSIDLRAKGALLISFYRGHWCPYCNLELQALQARFTDIAAKGVSLVAISPETPVQSLTVQQKHELNFPVLSDRGNRIAKQFGLVFALDETLKPIYQTFGIDLKAYNGDTSYELPIPATYLVDKNGTVLESFLDVDYRKRLAPESVLRWLDRLAA